MSKWVSFVIMNFFNLIYLSEYWTWLGVQLSWDLKILYVILSCFQLDSSIDINLELDPESSLLSILFTTRSPKLIYTLSWITKVRNGWRHRKASFLDFLTCTTLNRIWKLRSSERNKMKSTWGHSGN